MFSVGAVCETRFKVKIHKAIAHAAASSTLATYRLDLQRPLLTHATEQLSGAHVVVAHLDHFCGTAPARGGLLHTAAPVPGKSGSPVHPKNRQSAPKVLLQTASEDARALQNSQPSGSCLTVLACTSMCLRCSREMCPRQAANARAWQRGVAKPTAGTGLTHSLTASHCQGCCSSHSRLGLFAEEGRSRPLAVSMLAASVCELIHIWARLGA